MHSRSHLIRTRPAALRPESPGTTPDCPAECRSNRNCVRAKRQPRVWRAALRIGLSNSALHKEFLASSTSVVRSRLCRVPLARPQPRGQVHRPGTGAGQTVLFRVIEGRANPHAGQLLEDAAASAVDSRRRKCKRLLCGDQCFADSSTALPPRVAQQAKSFRFIERLLNPLRVPTSRPGVSAFRSTLAALAWASEARSSSAPIVGEQAGDPSHVVHIGLAPRYAFRLPSLGTTIQPVRTRAARDTAPSGTNASQQGYGEPSARTIPTTLR